MSDVVSKLNIDNIDYDIKDRLSRNPNWDETYEEGSLPVAEEYVGTSIHKITDALNSYATKNELSTAVTTLQTNFQNGVDLIAKACDDRGSTPAGQYPYTPEAVADAIRAIPSGGGTPYSMFPQEVLGFIYGGDSCDFHYNIVDNDNVVVAHIIPTTDDSSITMNFSIQLRSYYSGTVTFSIIIDNETTIPNIASAVMDASTGDEKVVSFSYTFSPALTPEYHVITLKVNMTEGLYQVDIVSPLCNLYGYNFISAVNVGYYLINGAFSNYYIPSNFINPSNCITYELDHGSGCGFPLEDETAAMNNHYANQFDTGTCFYMKGIDAYEKYNEETGEYDVIVPDILDVFMFNNGKFRYTHSVVRSIGYEVSEYHYFILPVTNIFLNSFEQINIHGRMVSKSGNINGYARIAHFDLMRQNLNRVERYGSSEYDGIYLNDLSEGDEFTLISDLHKPTSNYISFIGIAIISTKIDNDPFTLEIDKIWGTIV